MKPSSLLLLVTRSVFDLQVGDISCTLTCTPSPEKGRHDPWHNDTQHSDIQHENKYIVTLSIMDLSKIALET
jgi:hypothetical protein